MFYHRIKGSKENFHFIFLKVCDIFIITLFPIYSFDFDFQKMGVWYVIFLSLDSARSKIWTKAYASGKINAFPKVKDNQVSHLCHLLENRAYYAWYHNERETMKKCKANNIAEYKVLSILYLEKSLSFVRSDCNQAVVIIWNLNKHVIKH